MADIQQTHILNLPPHVLTDIFDSVADKDLIRLTKVCRYFNDIISNNAKFLVKMPVDLSQFTLRKQWVGNRKYNNIAVTMDKFEDFLPLMKTIAENIVKFKFSPFSQKIIGRRNRRLQREVVAAFDIDKLVELLEKMPKLKYLDISLPTQVNAKLSKNESKLKLNLEKLEGNMSFNLLPLFYDCNVKRFDGRDSDWFNSASTSNALVKFLKNQKELQELAFKPLGRQNVLKDESLMNVDFKLKKFQLHSGYGDNIDYVIKFLLQFKDSLELLFLERYDERILRALLNFENLRTLEFYQYTTLRRLPDIALINIEQVTIASEIPPNFPLVFPNLRHLEIFQPLNINIIEQLTNLESISIKCSDIVIPRTTAKILTLKYRQSPLPRPFDYDNNNFEEIYVIKHTVNRPRWLKEFIDGGYAANLKIFEVTTQKFE